MRIRWTRAAAADLSEINSYLTMRHPTYRIPTLKKIYAKAQSLKQSPLRGREGRIEGTRELVLVPLPYIIVYRLHDGDVELLRVLHAARNR